MKQQLERWSAEIKTKVVALGTHEVREDRILNRVVRVTNEGLKMEADQRHADVIIASLG